MSSILIEAIGIISRGVEGHQTGIKPPNIQAEPGRQKISVDINNGSRDTTHSPKALLNSLLASVGHQYLETMPAQTTPTVTEMVRFIAS